MLYIVSRVNYISKSNIKIIILFETCKPEKKMEIERNIEI